MIFLTEQNGAQSLWENKKEERYTIDDAVITLYMDIVDKCIECMENFEAVYKHEYLLEKRRCSETEEIIYQLSERLEERGLVFEIQKTENEKILVTVYLLQKTEEQYKEIQKLKEEKRKNEMESETLTSYAVLVLVLLLVLDGQILFCFSFVIIIAVCYFIAWKIHTSSEKKFNEYIQTQERIFCNSSTEIEKIKELEKKYNS